ncbi:Putative thymidylate kinase, P-loop containing nucleoside triphosphate hydrolase [Septoria linicola]|uniref:Thymidylate kinase n=1 Tax=Septoria linicola TaxID=215465 RepID=A0A9Q9ASP5_9PEZI|nr:putative thymidylate kinase, P-loop containing nucleoside triphosphate hydrolase [Septoria linicola]USW51433.1 Putative thymidylate kinase, P-loop containing nucleoside triphosphate hydrolase [Septoria linicola]
MASQRGHLIVFEGLDRSGKSTQCARLVDHLIAQGQKVEYMRFPNRGTVIGQMINNYLVGSSNQEDHAIHLLFSANRWEAAEDIKRHLQAGTTVVVDRYYYSGCVYSAAKQNPTMDLAWCRHPEVGLPRPDLCLFLDISAEDAAKRGGFGSERYEKQEMQDRVRSLFAEMRTHPDEAEDIVTIDAGRTVEEVGRTIQDSVARLSEAQPGPLRYINPW